MGATWHDACKAPGPCSMQRQVPNCPRSQTLHRLLTFSMLQTGGNLRLQVIKQQLADGVSIRRVGFVSTGAPARKDAEVRGWGCRAGGVRGCGEPRVPGGGVRGWVAGLGCGVGLPVGHAHRLFAGVPCPAACYLASCQLDPRCMPPAIFPHAAGKDASPSCRRSLPPTAPPRLAPSPAAPSAPASRRTSPWGEPACKEKGGKGALKGRGKRLLVGEPGSAFFRTGGATGLLEWPGVAAWRTQGHHAGAGGTLHSILPPPCRIIRARAGRAYVAMGPSPGCLASFACAVCQQGAL